MQKIMWLYLSRSLWGIPVCWDLFRKIIAPQNFLFIETNNWIVLAVRWPVKYFWLQILWYFGQGWQKSEKNEKNTGNCKALYTSHKRKKWDKIMKRCNKCLCLVSLVNMNKCIWGRACDRLESCYKKAQETYKRWSFTIC